MGEARRRKTARKATLPADLDRDLDLPLNHDSPKVTAALGPLARDLRVVLQVTPDLPPEAVTGLGIQVAALFVKRAGAAMRERRPSFDRETSEAGALALLVDFVPRPLPPEDANWLATVQWDHPTVRSGAASAEGLQPYLDDLIARHAGQLTGDDLVMVLLGAVAVCLDVVGAALPEEFRRKTDGPQIALHMLNQTMGEPVGLSPTSGS